MRPDKTKAEQRREEKVIVTAGEAKTHGFVRADCATAGVAFACLPYFTVTSAACSEKFEAERTARRRRAFHRDGDNIGKRRRASNPNIVS